MKSISWQNHIKYGYRIEKTGVCQAKWLTVTWTFGSRMDQKLTTPLLQVFMEQGITTGKVFLWAASLTASVV